MFRKILLSGFVLFLALPAAAQLPYQGAVMQPYSGPAPKIKAGVASADPTGFLGASAGQYANETSSGPGSVFPDKRDPQAYSSAKTGTYGVQSRLTTRALVIEGANGKRIVLLKTDHYLAQDLFLRRIGQLLASGSSGITPAQILHHVTHNHSSPYQLTQAAGVWVFQDAFNGIAFEHEARAAAQAIEQAAANLKPARMGATQLAHDTIKANIVGASTAIDGTPAGYPRDYGDNAIVVMRFDDLSNPQQPQPLAVWMNHGQHPESLDGYHLVSGDYVTMTERFVNRDSGALLVFSQGDVGSAEGPYADRGDTPNRILAGADLGVYREWAHNGYAQAERAGRILADAVMQAYNLIGSGDASVTVPYSTDFPIDYYDYWVTGPVSHPYPSVSNCSAAQTYQGDPGVPVAGLPDCARAEDNGFPGLPDFLTLITGGAAGQAAPSHYDAPGHPAVEENQRLHLQAMRAGEVLLASCACEAQVDLILNLESRTDNKAGNIYDGFDWACLLPQYGGEAICNRQKDFYDHTPLTTTIPGPNRDPAAIAHMRAQVHNDAAGWDLPANAVAAQAQEPADISQIWGNFTKEELPANRGYALPVGIGHAGDYNGYTISYREYMSRDSYRKALTAYGPHTADYMATRLTRMAGFMKGGPAVPAETNAAQGAADEQRMAGQATTVGQQTGAQYDQRLTSAPNDPTTAAILQQPLSVERYRAATMRWRGGSNAVDNPKVRVERRLNGQWQFFADQSGEVQTMLVFPTQAQESAARSGSFEWQWLASFEAFQPFPEHLANGTPNGEYRFVVDGQSRVGGANAAYHFESNVFEIKPWSGIPVNGYALDDLGDVSFSIPAYSYPRSYVSTFPVIADDGRQTVCKTCSFRPWARSGVPVTVTVSVSRADGSSTLLPALKGGDGLWHAQTRLGPGDTANLARGAVLDSHGEINGALQSLSVPQGGVPDPFNFLERTGVATKSFITSETVTLSGFAGLVSVSVSEGGQYRINDGAYTNQLGRISAGERLTVRQLSAATENSSRQIVVRVSSRSAVFKVTTTSVDRVPDAFTFGIKSNQEPGVVVESAITPLSGFETAPIVAGPDVEYRINGVGSYTRSNGSLQAGQSLQVRHTSNTASLGYSKTYLKVGGVTGYFTTRTKK